MHSKLFAGDFAKLCTGAIDDLPDAPSRVDWSEEASKEALSRREWKVVSYEDEQLSLFAHRCDFEAEAVAAYDEKPG